MELTALQIAFLYKNRWQVELFINTDYKNVKEPFYKQLNINWI
jgi:hypothetical protein